VPGCNCSENARVEDAAEQQPDPLLLRQRHEGRQRRLLQQRIAAGEQHRVEIAGAGEALAHRGLVDADADRPDRTGGAQALQRAIGAIHGLGEPALDRLGPVRPDVDVVDQHDVDPVRAEAQGRLLERAQRAVMGIIEAQAVRQAAGIARAVATAGEGLGHTPDFRREHDAVARHAPQRSPDAVLRKTVTVERRGVEQGDAGRQRGLDRRHRLPVVQPGIEIAQWRAAEAERREGERGAAEAAGSGGGGGHRRRSCWSPQTMCTPTCQLATGFEAG
jgi:hypothetical protein